ncbi:rotatin isoform X3 [Takifugu rubripes]|uniref:rotatin isoform X3 n=1 Tax=Takifugu rubripes TaxID=31033 RepID=UPI001145C592|nr:rotatin isoform X3 [Takifugu rubripes]
MELSSLIKKTGHSLVEIRVRALKSIMCKLDYSLISVSDIVQEKMLFVHLLEWFNFPQVPMQEEVLELLSTLAKHPSAAQMLRDIGAVDFLIHLSPNVEPRLRAVIDGTLDQLFHLPELLPSHAVLSSHGQHSTAPTAPTSLAHQEQFPKMGYFHTTRPSQTDVSLQRIAVHKSVKCLKFSVFPWLTLSNTDRHILSSNESSLKSSNPNLIRTTCELLCDVIMQDFPAEIFLQRPQIFKNLLSLLRLGSSKGEAGFLHLQALSCLRQLCVGLRRRLRFHQDPSFYSTKQDLVSQNSSFSYSHELQSQRSQASSPAAECSPRPSVVGHTGQRARGDGQDRDAGSNRGAGAIQAPRQSPQSPADVTYLAIPDVGVEDVLELQFQQLTVAQFTVATMEHAIPLLKAESSHMFHRVLELLCEAVVLLRESVSELVWDDGSLVGIELKTKLHGCMELLGDTLCHHENYAADIPRSCQVHHRMAYTGTAVFIIKFLQAILPLEKACDNIPENTATAIFHLCLDRTFGILLPSVQEAAVAYLEQVDSDSYGLYRRVTRAALWMESTCSFLKEIQAKGEKKWFDLLELAGQAIEGLPFHQHLPVIQECIHMCSYLWKFEQPSPVLQTESQKLLLRLLSHPLLQVRVETYGCTLSLVKDCLGIQNVSRHELGVCSGVTFLLHHRVLYEISAFGLQDSAEKVNAAAKDILLFLLKGQLMMTVSTWDRFNEALYPVMPILQGYASTEGSLGNSILLISDMSDVARDPSFPAEVKLRAALRLLFTKQPTVRIAAVQQILPHLAGAEDANTARPNLDQAVVSLLPNLYCLRNTVIIALDTSNESVLKVESVEKLFCILSSDMMNISLRISAAEQLTIVLQDAAMHPVLKNLGIADKVISFIFESVNGNKSLDGLLEPCVCILRKLVYADSSLRHRLALHTLLLLTLLRASLILKENKASGCEIAILMSLLLFDEVATLEKWSDDTDVARTPFSLPLSLTQRYNIPFQPATYHAVSPFCCILPPSAEVLSLPPARQALQFAWNISWHSGIDKLLDVLCGPATDVTEFHPDLQLSEAQVVWLQVAHRPTALQGCIAAIVSAEGHLSVTSALSRLNLHLLVDRLALPHVPTYSCRKTLQFLSWQAAMTRFLQVHPASGEDERLLVAIVKFLNACFRDIHIKPASAPEDKDLRWILELLLNQDTESLLNLLHGVESQSSAQGSREPAQNHVSRGLQRELTTFFNLVLLRLADTTDRLCLALGGPFKSQLAVRLFQSLRVSDAPRFYGLPSLERTLQGMVSLTAHPGWSTHYPDLEPTMLCSKYLSGLLEVISSFYVEWGGNSMSFMGKGVTKSALISLLHLSHEMTSMNNDKDLIAQWSLGHEAASEDTSASQLGLAWLIPLWVDRDQEVRCASLGLGAALSSVPSGCQALCVSCQNISGGLWGTLLNILLDQHESSMVRREAAFILQSLLVMPMPANAEEAKDTHWQQPCVHDEVSGVSLVGLPALQAMLYHCQYFQHVAVSASNCYQGRYTFPLQAHADTISGPDPQAVNLFDSENSLWFWRSDPQASTGNSRRPSSSLSTSSTVVKDSVLLTPLQGPSAVSITEDIPAKRLMAQGQSDTDINSSMTSPDSQQKVPTAPDPIVMVTPDLMTAHCGLLTNLLAILPDFTLSALRHVRLLQALAGLVLTGPIEKCLLELKMQNILPGEMEDIKIQFVVQLQFLSSFSKLLQSCVTVSPNLIGQMDTLKLISALVAVLTLDTRFLDAGTQDAVCVSWTDLFMLLATVVRRDSSAAYPSVSTALGRRWRAFAETLSVCLNEKSANLQLHTAALRFLCTVLKEETKNRGVEITTSNCNPAPALCDIVRCPSAGQLCELLLQSFEKVTFQDSIKKLASRALMTLLACSPAAQTYAAKAGFIENCVEQLKQSHSQLNLESVRPEKALHRKKEESCMKEVKLTVEMLQSALYCSDECKGVATDARLTLALYALWPWLLLDDPTMEAVLELLCVYTASFPTGCSALCGSGTDPAPGTKALLGNSLMHSVMKLALGVTPDNGTIQKLAFSLLANLAMSHDCRGVLQKNNFLQAFPKAGASKATIAVSGGGGSGRSLLGLWLTLLVNLSFAEDGQQSILRVRGALELLADLAQHRHPALLTLHNLCFCSANKPHILANGTGRLNKAMKVLLCCLDSEATETCCMGVSGLWALLHNNQRAKTRLKCPTVQLRIQEAHARFKKELENKQEPTSAYLLKCLENLSQLLKH